MSHTSFFAPGVPEAAEHPKLATARQAIRTSPSALIVTDPRQPDNPIVCANEAFLRLTGYGEDEVVGRNCRFLQGPDTHPEAISALREAIRDGRAVIATLTNYTREGRRFLNCVQIEPVRDEAGEVVLFIGAQFEVTPLERLFPMSEAASFSGA